MNINFAEKKGFICDMDGVIYHGNNILPGAAAFIEWLKKENIGNIENTYSSEYAMGFREETRRSEVCNIVPASHCSNDRNISA